jgi:hypothetical protein
MWAALLSVLALSPPKLVVLLAVDQMRADYVDWYGAGWKHGLRRLLDGGAQMRNARYPYLHTITCPGHATLATGTYPHSHGMVNNAWYDRARGKLVECTDDPDAPLVAHGGRAPLRPGVGHSARNLLAPTLADAMQAQLAPRPRVASFSIKARAAIDLGGHAPDVALWFDGGLWVTSSRFARAPIAWVEELVSATPPAATLEHEWTRLMPAAAYRFADDATGESPPTGWTRTFPHVLRSDGTPGLGKWANSPAADDYLVRLATAALAHMHLGQGPATDFLAVSFSETDIVGHQFGPRSHEVQDVLARLDVDLGRLLDALDRHVGRDGYVLALSADHGVAVIPEQARAEGKDAGRVPSRDLRARVNDAVAAEIGPGVHVAELLGSDVYLTTAARDALAVRPGAAARVLAAVRALPGVARAFDRSELRDASLAKEPLQRAAALSYYDGRSPDIVVAPRRDWVVGDVGTSHGSAHDYDQRVPVVFYGRGIRPGTYDLPVSPADVAPTLARIAGVRLPRAEGRAVVEVLAR